MRAKILVVLAVLLGLSSISPVRAQSYVSDEARLFSPRAVKQAESRIAEIRRQSGKELRIQTINGFSTPTIDAEAVQRFDNQGIQGILVLISMNPRKIAVRVGSHTAQMFDGREESELRLGMASNLKAGNPDAALSNAVQYVSTHLDAPAVTRNNPVNSTVAVPPAAPAVPREPGNPLRTIGLWILILAMLALFVKWALARYKKAQEKEEDTLYTPTSSYIGSSTTDTSYQVHDEPVVPSPPRGEKVEEPTPTPKVSTKPDPHPADVAATEEIKTRTRRRKSSKSVITSSEDYDRAQRNRRSNNTTYVDNSTTILPVPIYDTHHHHHHHDNDDDSSSRGRSSRDDSDTIDRTDRVDTSSIGSSSIFDSSGSDSVDTSSSGGSSDWGSSSGGSSYDSGSSSGGSSYDSGSSSYDSGSSGSDSGSSGGSSDF